MTTELEQAERELAQVRRNQSSAQECADALGKTAAALEARVESLRKAVPLRLWANVYASGAICYCLTKERAIDEAGPCAVRIAVEMVEVPEGWQCRGPLTRQEMLAVSIAYHKTARNNADLDAANAALGFGGGK